MRVAVLVMLLVAAASPPVASAAASAPWDAAKPGMIARLPDGRRVNFRCQGVGAPAVLLESGFGGTSMAWFKVAPLLSGSHRVCAYDRAGSGFSDPGPAPRDGAAIARDLDLGLRALRLRGPFIVVGHSSGGLYVRAFANRRPKDVVGMVLVDPSVEFQDRRFAAVFGPGAGSLDLQRAKAERCLAAAQHGRPRFDDPILKACLPTPKAGETRKARAARVADALRRRIWQTQISELDALWTTTSDEIAAGRASYGAMPLIVLTADGTNADAPPPARGVIDALWRRLHQELAARSTRGEERLIARTSHLMMLDRPDAVAKAIDDAANEAGRSGPGT
jgi:pimeloyl-ACP methyl ester carboxylesterase